MNYTYLLCFVIIIIIIIFIIYSYKTDNNNESYTMINNTCQFEPREMTATTITPLELGSDINPPPAPIHFFNKKPYPSPEPNNFDIHAKFNSEKPPTALNAGEYSPQKITNIAANKIKPTSQPFSNKYTPLTINLDADIPIHKFVSPNQGISIKTIYTNKLPDFPLKDLEIATDGPRSDINPKASIDSLKSTTMNSIQIANPSKVEIPKPIIK